MMILPFVRRAQSLPAQSQAADDGARRYDAGGARRYFGSGASDHRKRGGLQRPAGSPSYRDERDSMDGEPQYCNSAVPAAEGPPSRAISPSVAASRDGGPLLSAVLDAADAYPVDPVSYAPAVAEARDILRGLDGLAELLRALTYGEMIDLAAGLARTGNGSPITERELPAAWHLWATEVRP